MSDAEVAIPWADRDDRNHPPEPHWCRCRCDETLDRNCSEHGWQVAAVTADADPIVAAVAEARQEAGFWGSGFDWDKLDRLVVTAHRRAVLDQRDGERVRQIRDEYERDSVPPLFAVRDLLAALADAEIARRQAEADREGLPEWRCPGCGAVTRARMADHGEDG